MNSTDFRGIIGAGLTSADKPRHMAKGGSARASAPPKGKHHLTVIIAAPPPAAAPPPMHPAAPVIGALMHAMILRHLMNGHRR